MLHVLPGQSEKYGRMDDVPLLSRFVVRVSMLHKKGPGRMIGPEAEVPEPD